MSELANKNSSNMSKGDVQDLIDWMMLDAISSINWNLLNTALAYGANVNVDYVRIQSDPSGRQNAVFTIMDLAERFQFAEKIIGCGFKTDALYSVRRSEAKRTIASYLLHSDTRTSPTKVKEWCQLLRKNKYDFSIADSDGRTPLMQAAGNYVNTPEIIKLIYKQAKIINVKDNSGRLAIHYFASTLSKMAESNSHYHKERFTAPDQINNLNEIFKLLSNNMELALVADATGQNSIDLLGKALQTKFGSELQALVIDAPHQDLEEYKNRKMKIKI